MSNLLSSMNMATRALAVNQQAINVASNNIANMNTEGYSKQRVNLETASNIISIGNNVGRQIKTNAGVQIGSITRYNNEYLKSYMREQNSLASYYSQASDLATGLQDIMNELNGTGLDSVLSGFYAAVNNLNEYPADSTARVNFIEQAKTLTTKFAYLTDELNKSGTNALGDGTSQASLDNSLASTTITELNSLLDELAVMNDTIAKVQTGDLSANNLLDNRDVLLKKLSEFMEFDYKEASNGTIDLSYQGMSLVKGNKVVGELNIRLPEADESGPAVIDIVNPETKEKVYASVNDTLNTGSLGAIVQSVNQDSDIMTAEKVISSLDKLATGIANVFNELQTREGAYCIDGTTMTLKESSAPLFISDEVDANGNYIFTAANIKVNDAFNDDPFLVATAYFEPGTFDPAKDSLAVGNATNVKAMLASRTDGTLYADLGNMTPENYLTALVGKIGVQAGNMSTNAESQADVVEGLNNKILAETGVDFNEELVDLIKYQRAYEASAKVFNVCNECLALLVTLGN